MPTGKARFLASAATLTLALSTGQTDSDTQVPPGGGGTPGTRYVTIETDRTTAHNTAPAGFMFKAIAHGFDVFDQRELRFKWSFDDPDAQVLDVLRAERFEPFGWRDSNVAYTNYATHVFAPPASRFAGASQRSYTVTCTVHDRLGNSAVGTFQVTVQNPDVIYAGSLTRIVAPDGDFSGSEQFVGAQQFTDMNAAFSSFNAEGGRVLLKRGFRYAFTSTTNPFKNKEKTQINAWGTGARPIWDVIAGKEIATENTPYLEFANVDIEGDWDSITESSPSGNNNAGGFTWPGVSGEKWHTIHNCHMRKNNSIGFLISGQPGGTGNQQLHLYISNTAIDEFRDYGLLFGVTHRVGIQGFAVRQHPDASQGGELGKGHNAHTNMRWTGPMADSWNVIDGFDGYSCHGWSRTDSYENVPELQALGLKANIMPAPQSCMRWNPGHKNIGALPAPLRLSRFVGEGGNTVFLGTVSYNPEVTYGDILLDKGVIICGSTAASGFGYGHKGAWVQNVLVIVPKMMMARGKDFSPISGATGDADHPSRVWGVTHVAWIEPVADKHGGGADLTALGPNSVNQRVMGNLYHAPNMPVPRDLSVDLDLSRRLFAPIWPGHRFNVWNGDVKISSQMFTRPEYKAHDTFTQGDKTQASVVLPVPKVGRVLAGTTPVPADDMFGTLRPIGSQRLGAIEPASVS